MECFVNSATAECSMFKLRQQSSETVIDVESSPSLTGRVADVGFSFCCHLVWPTLVEEVDGAER